MGHISCGSAAASIAVLLTNLAWSHAAPVTIADHLAPSAMLGQLDERQIALLEKLNRTDREHSRHLPELIVPNSWNADELGYSPLPTSVHDLESHEKAIVVHLASQAFGAYEQGRLVRWGPVSSGRAQFPSPVGLFFLHWRSRERTSTDNSNWRLSWYFNFHNKRGLAFHEYSLPGRPASHACIRLLHRDAEWVFQRGEGRKVSPGGWDVLRHVTPVWIIGEYEFSSGRPCLNAERWSKRIPLPRDIFAAGGG